MKSPTTVSVQLKTTLRPLAIAPIGALGVMTVFMLVVEHRPEALVMAVVVAPFVYAAELIFVVPIMIVLPHFRVPSLVGGAVWGILAGMLSIAAVDTPSGPWRLSSVPGVAVFWVCLSGATSGLLYSWLIAKEVRQSRTRM